MYIWTYKKNEILPEINFDDLQTIYELDKEWESIFQTRKTLEKHIQEFDQMTQIQLI